MCSSPAVFNDIFVLKVISSVLAVVALILTLFLKTFDLKTLAYRYKDTSNQLMELKNAFHILSMEITLLTINNEEDHLNEFDALKMQYEELLIELYQVYKQAPTASSKAIKLVKKSLEKQEVAK